MNNNLFFQHTKSIYNAIEVYFDAISLKKYPEFCIISPEEYFI